MQKGETEVALVAQWMAAMFNRGYMNVFSLLFSLFHFSQSLFTIRSFIPTSIHLQRFVSIQPRTGLSKFAKNWPKVRKKINLNKHRLAQSNTEPFLPTVGSQLPGMDATRSTVSGVAPQTRRPSTASGVVRRAKR